MKVPEAALDEYFGIFDSTIQLAKDLIKKKQHPQEILILLCARLDALASDTASGEVPNSEAFIRFVTGYGGHRSFFQGVSVGDLYYELGFHRWLLEGSIPKAGRLQRFSRVDDPALHLLVKSGVALTVKDAGRLIDKIMAAIRAKYRAVPHQPTTKPPFAKTSDITNTIVNAFKGPRLKDIGENLAAALCPLLRSTSVASILYRRFRNESIHGAQVLLDERRFFAETMPYWTTISTEDYGPYHLLEFPVHFLLNTLRQCARTFRTQIVKKGKLPPDVFFHVLTEDMFEYLELLDHEMLPKPQYLKFHEGQ